jgi:hypothetical protein
LVSWAACSTQASIGVPTFYPQQNRCNESKY